MLCCCTFSCTSSRTSCYAAARSLALRHIRHATLLQVLLHFQAYYRPTNWGGVGWGGMLTFIATAALYSVLLQFLTYVMLCCCTFSCISSHTSCYAAAHSPAGLHISHATLLQWLRLADRHWRSCKISHAVKRKGVFLRSPGFAAQNPVRVANHTETDVFFSWSFAT